MAESNHKHLYENLEVKRLEKAEVEISGSIPEVNYQPLRKKALKHLLENLELPGFRKGHVPESVFIERFGEAAILEEIADLALRDSYPHIVIDEKLDVLGSPEIAITKLAKGNPIEFKIKTAVYPSVTLPDYKNIAKKENAKKEDFEVKEKEIEDTIKHIRKSRIAHDKKITKEEAEKEENWPAYDDAFVQKLGSFTGVADFEKKLKENIVAEKKRVAGEKKRASILEQLATSAQFEVPEVLIRSELNKMLAQFEGDVNRMGATLPQYLEHIKKSKDDMLAEWKGDAEKRAKLEIILHEIATQEKLAPIEEDIVNEINHLKEHHKNADPERLRIYVESMLEKDQVMRFLEEQV